MVWTLPPPDQRRPQGQGGKGRRTVRWPPATTTPPPHEPLAGAQATGEPHPRQAERGESKLRGNLKSP